MMYISIWVSLPQPCLVNKDMTGMLHGTEEEDEEDHQVSARHIVAERNGGSPKQGLHSLGVIAASAINEKLKLCGASQTSLSILNSHNPRLLTQKPAGTDTDPEDQPLNSGNKLLFIFSEDNVIRKYARIIIDWGYPFKAWVCFLLLWYSIKVVFLIHL